THTHTHTHTHTSSSTHTHPGDGRFGHRDRGHGRLGGHKTQTHHQHTHTHTHTHSPHPGRSLLTSANCVPWFGSAIPARALSQTARSVVLRAALIQASGWQISIPQMLCVNAAGFCACHTHTHTTQNH